MSKNKNKNKHNIPGLTLDTVKDNNNNNKNHKRTQSESFVNTNKMNKFKLDNISGEFIEIPLDDDINKDNKVTSARINGSEPLTSPTERQIKTDRKFKTSNPENKKTQSHVVETRTRSFSNRIFTNIKNFVKDKSNESLNEKNNEKNNQTRLVRTNSLSIFEENKKDSDSDTSQDTSQTSEGQNQLANIISSESSFECDELSKRLFIQFKKGLSWEMLSLKEKYIEHNIKLKLLYNHYKLSDKLGYISTDHEIQYQRLTATQYIVIESIINFHDRRVFQYFFNIRELLAKTKFRCIDETSYNVSTDILIDFFIIVKYSYEKSIQLTASDDYYYPNHFFIAPLTMFCSDKLLIYPITINNGKPVVKLSKTDLSPLTYKELEELCINGKYKRNIEVKKDLIQYVDFYVFDLLDFVLTDFSTNC